MKERAAYFETMDDVRLMEINGGGFAYDVGRVLRFIAVSALCATPISTANAVADWIMVDAVNEAANNPQ